MNPRIIKESRALLPAFGVSLLAAIVPSLIWRGEEVGLFLFGVGCALMAASAFGNEFHGRTMPLLLSQPLSRRRVWFEKMLVLGVVLLLGFATFLICLRPRAADFPTVAFVLAAIPCCIFCTTPCLTLITKNTLLGVLLSAGPPMLIGGITGFLIWAFSLEAWLQRHPIPYPYFAIPVVIYCALFFRLGYKQFARLQMVDPYTQELSLPARLETAFARPLQKLVPGYTGPFASLVKKELRLQQISFLGAAVFFAIAVAGGLLYPWHITVSADKLDLAVITLAMDFGFYPLILPFIAGALSVAEEKAWGVADWQVTLPPSLRKQWSIKMLVALATSLILGLLLPAALALTGIKILGIDHPPDLIPPGPVIVAFVVGYLLLTSAVVYAASLSKSTVGAIILAVVMLFMAWLSMDMELKFLGASLVRNQMLNAFWPIQLPDRVVAGIFCAGMFVLLALTQLFAYLSYRARGLTITQRIVQALVLLITLFCLILAVLVASASFLADAASGAPGMPH